MDPSGLSVEGSSSGGNMLEIVVTPFSSLKGTKDHLPNQLIPDIPHARVTQVKGLIMMSISVEKSKKNHHNDRAVLSVLDHTGLLSIFTKVTPLRHIAPNEGHAPSFRCSCLTTLPCGSLMLPTSLLLSPLRCSNPWPDTSQKR